MTTPGRDDTTAALGLASVIGRALHEQTVYISHSHIREQVARIVADAVVAAGWTPPLPAPAPGRDDTTGAGVASEDAMVVAPLSPVCPTWLYAAVRHAARNMTEVCSVHGDDCAPDRHDGTQIATVYNAALRADISLPADARNVLVAVMREHFFYLHAGGMRCRCGADAMDGDGSKQHAADVIMAALTPAATPGRDELREQIAAARAEVLRYAAAQQDEHTQWLKEHRSENEPHHTADLHRAFESDDAAKALRRLADECDQGIAKAAPTVALSHFSTVPLSVAAESPRTDGPVAAGTQTALVAVLTDHQWDGDDTDPHCTCGQNVHGGTIAQHQADAAASVVDTWVAAHTAESADAIATMDAGITNAAIESRHRLVVAASDKFLAERDEARTSVDKWSRRAHAAEAAVARVRALCDDDSWSYHREILAALDPPTEGQT